jgi:alpha-mannosidase
MRHQKRWTSQKIRKRLELIGPLVYRRRRQIASFYYLELNEPTHDPPALSETNQTEWKRIEPGDYWLGPSTSFLLHSSFSFPSTATNREPIALYLPLGEAGDFSHPEAMVYVDQRRLAACDRHHQEVSLPARYCDDQEHDLLLYGWTGGTRQPDTKRIQMNRCWVVQIHSPLREFIAVARVALGIAESLAEDDPVRHNLINVLDRAFLALDTRSPIDDRFYTSIPVALSDLRKGVDRSGRPLDVDITAIGHAHLDVAWLWTLGETRRKAGKTFANMVRLMEKYPEFRFTQSQPQLYDYVRRDYPDLFEAAQERVEAGQWELIGGMWVEADCNLTGAESLVRQLLLGRTFFRDYFGDEKESPVLWLPDVFGYTANLPQLIQKAGLKYFFTIKLGWNQYNRLPYDTFWWEGIDGTRVLTHFSPTKQPDSDMVATYNGDASPGQVLSTWTNFQQKDLGKPGEPPPILMAYGYGDGGGGPTHEMIENIELLDAFPGAPRVRFGTAIGFFEELERVVGDQLPTWKGELYLEYHRGTYTTQGRIKRANRKSETLLHDTEFVAALASVLSDDYRYPHQEFIAAWKLLCLNQFHDILPGSSIAQVYTEASEQYDELTTQVGSLLHQALAALSPKVDTRCSVLLVNASPFPQTHPVMITAENEIESSSETSWMDAFPNQKVENGWLIDPGPLAPYSITPLCPGIEKLHAGKSSFDDLVATPRLLENSFLRVELDENGDIERILDKKQSREVIPAGEIANQFQLFEDRPRIPDAWDIDIFYDDKLWQAEPASSVVVKEDGPLRATLEVSRGLFASDMVQRISLYRDSPLLVFDTEVDWKERFTLLKVAFPVEILSSFASYDIQWGHVQRPTHENTSWDWARFETCAHKWVDLSEGGYGVALINDCKYGHDIHDNVIRLTLLRGTTDPDPQADIGHHEFSYALLPHTGPLDESVLAAAYGFNDPPFSFLINDESRAVGPSRSRLDGRSIISSASSNVIVETIKRAENGNGVIIRLYESMRKRGDVQLSCIFPLDSVWRTDLLEADIERIDTEGSCFELSVKPFEIITLRLVPILQRDQPSLFI